MLTLNMKNRIMFRIYLIYIMRKFQSPFMAPALALTILTFVLFYFVSVPNVFSNMMESGSFSKYLMIAFSNTTLVVQIISLFIFGVLIYFVRNVTVHAILKTRLA